ncbi:sulfite exporter TauE/SafE family protein 3-like [Phalaenopsis equestris]|uniref:sulfite exporter TauE/SafE family protein 3-like n=1 Tax=Phalaenopsis equestris TaxID=78828 RepID=UPI0009E364F8|nr:sulfite exporter TauE/SafE family protein 3-like [Phalaenopsis equestris]
MGEKWRRSIDLMFSILLIFITALALVSADRGLMNRIPAMAEKEKEDSSYLTKVLGFLWRADGSGYHHVWPPMKFGWQIVVGSVVGFFGAALGSVGGVGGGGIFVPMLALIIGFDPKSSTAISKCMITGAAASTVYYNLRLRHPTLDTSLIDYDLALLFQPMLMLGISIGVIFNVVFPDWMVTVLLIILFLVTSTMAFMRGVETWKKETLMKKEAAKNPEFKDANEEAEYKLIPGGPGNTAQMEDNSDTEQEFSIIENVSWKDLGLLLFVWIAFLALQITKNHTRTCSVWYWVLNLLQIPVSVGVSLYEAVSLYKGRRVIASKGEVVTEWKIHQLVIYCLFGIIAGMVGGLLGLGGGFILGPLFLELGIPPQVSSATATFAMTFSASMSVVQYYLLSRFPVPYAIYFAAVATVAAFVGQHVVRKIILIMGRASLIIFILAFTIFISAISLGGVGISRMIHKIQLQEYMGFENLCLA